MSDATNWLKDNSGGGDGGPGVYFDTPGDKVVGVIVGTPRKVDTEFGERLVVELTATGESTASKGTRGADGVIADGDSVTVWCKPGAMASAIARACNEAGVQGLSEGDTLALAYSGDGEQKKAGWNAPKLYVARYTIAKPAVSVDSLV
jgi:ApbE superfamily uncharacterized protein (UPF0280 family)